VPFVWRTWQQELYAETEWFKKRKRPAKIRVPKARGTGASSWTLSLIGFCRPLRRPGYRTFAIAQDQDEAEEHLSRLTDFYEQVDWEALKQLGIEREKSNRSSIVIVFRDPKTKRFLGRSKVRVRTAKAKGLGRGGGYDAVLTTERPHWPENAQRGLHSFLTRLSSSPWSVHIDESSPLGLGTFYKDCLAAQKGRGGYHLFFIPCFRRPENYRRFENEQQIHDLKASIGSDDTFGGSVEMTHYQRCAEYWASEGLEPEAVEDKALRFLNWRREEIEGNCGGSVKNFFQEHSTTFEEGFQGSDRPVFKTHVSTTWARVAEERKWRRGNFVEKKSSVIFEPHPRGLWLLSDEPQPEDIHCWGLDIASGKERISGSGAEADFTDMTIDNAYSGRTVAEMHAHIWPHEVLPEILNAAWYFRRRGLDEPAKGIIELNMDHGSLSSQVQRATPFWGDGEKCLLLVPRSVKTSAGVERSEEYGWWTGEATKPELLRAIHEAIDEYGRWQEGKTILPCPWTREQLEEISRYVYIQRAGRGGAYMGAESGHDDRVISKALALTARRLLMENGEIQTSSRLKPKVKTPQEELEAFWLGQAKQEREKRRNQKDAILGRAF